MAGKPTGRPKRPTVTARFGLPESAPWSGIPRALRAFAKARDMSAAQLLVVEALLDSWRPERGTIVSPSLRAIAELCPFTPERVRQTLEELTRDRLLGRAPKHGARTDTDLAPLLAHVRIFHATGNAFPGEDVQQHLLLAPDTSTVKPAGQLFPPSTVKPAGQHCQVSGSGTVNSQAHPQAPSESENYLQRGGGPVSDAPTAALDVVAPHGAENGNSTAKQVIADVLTRLSGRAPRPPISDAERAAHAERVRQQIAESDAEVLRISNDGG